MERLSLCPRGSAVAGRHPAGSGPEPQTVLVVGKADSAAVEHASGCGSTVVMPGLAGLDGATLGQIAPSCIVFSLIAGTFDASDVLRRLNTLGYAGRACVLVPPLPNQRLVERELRALAPAVSLTLSRGVSDPPAPPPPQHPR